MRPNGKNSVGALLPLNVSILAVGRLDRVDRLRYVVCHPYAEHIHPLALFELADNPLAEPQQRIRS